MTDSSGLLMSLTDVAALARVRRPVVSVWRSRSAQSPRPFPQPVATVRGQQRFDVAEVVNWLEVTGRGNNSDVRADAAAFASPKGLTADDDSTVFDGMTALLCLEAITGAPLAGLASSAVSRLAREADEGDTMLVSEINALGVQLPRACTLAALLSEAAYGPAQAFEVLLEQRRKLTARQDFAPPLHDLVGDLGWAFGREVGDDATSYVDATPGGSEVGFSLVGRIRSGSLLTVEQSGEASRLLRRRLRAHDIFHQVVPTDEDGNFQLTSPAVVIGCYRPGMAADELLSAVDNIQLQMDDGQRAVVVGPAAVLCDRIADASVDAQRDHLLRLGRVRAVVRLPRGLWPAAVRQRLGLWVLGPAHDDVGLEDRWTAVVDLTDVELSSSTVSDLVGDLVAAVAPWSLVRAHLFRFARLRPTTALLAERRELVPPGASAGDGRLVPPAQQALGIERLLASLRASRFASPLDGLRPTVTSIEPVRASISIGDALVARWLDVLPGNRLEADRLAPGTVRVIGVQELLGERAVGAVTVDSLDLAAAHPGAGRTEPGDVVFCRSPRPSALVDDAGGSVVAYPARILRLRGGSGLLPAVVARDIGRVAPGNHDWRSWRVHRIADDDATDVTAALGWIEQAEVDARERIIALEELAMRIVDGVSSRSLSLSTGISPTATTEGR